MGEVVNLRKARKAVARKDATQKATENAVKFGRSKARKALDTAVADKTTRDLDGKKRE